MYLELESQGPKPAAQNLLQILPFNNHVRFPKPSEHAYPNSLVDACMHSGKPNFADSITVEEETDLKLATILDVTLPP